MAVAYSSQWVDICSEAVVRLGKPPIVSLTEGTAAANFCNLYLGTAIEQILSRANWSAPRKRANLNRLIGTPIGYAYQYALPNDFIRPVDVQTEELPYVIENRSLLTDSETVSMVYVNRPDDVAELPGPLKNLISVYLALKLVAPLVASSEVHNRIFGEYQTANTEAIRSDHQFNDSDDIKDIRGYSWYGDNR
jgi:hypothetical protein